MQNISMMALTLTFFLLFLYILNESVTKNLQNSSVLENIWIDTKFSFWDLSCNSVYNYPVPPMGRPHFRLVSFKMVLNYIHWCKLK